MKEFPLPPELVIDIVSYLTLGRDLVNAALICKAFCGPAWDIIWKSLPSTVPLVMTLEGVQEVPYCWVSQLFQLLDVCY